MTCPATPTPDPAEHRRFAYENPADLAWSAQMVRTWAKRRRARLAAEQAELQPIHEDDDT